MIVIWSDQKNKTVYCREQKNDRPFKDWEEVQNLVLAWHTAYDYTNKKRYADRIAFGIIDTASAALLVKQVNVIVPYTALEIMINNITVLGAAFPADGSWIILASDKKGNIYRADLKPSLTGLNIVKDKISIKHKITLHLKKTYLLVLLRGGISILSKEVTCW